MDHGTEEVVWQWSIGWTTAQRRLCGSGGIGWTMAQRRLCGSGGIGWTTVQPIL